MELRERAVCPGRCCALGFPAGGDGSALPPWRSQCHAVSHDAVVFTLQPMHHVTHGTGRCCTAPVMR